VLFGQPFHAGAHAVRGLQGFAHAIAVEGQRAAGCSGRAAAIGRELNMAEGLRIALCDDQELVPEAPE
jgi:hypothetical protein